MRALLDTNVFISYLLGAGPGGTIGQLVAAALQGTFALLLPAELTDELLASVRGKAYLAQRIDLADATAFVRQLTVVGEVIPTLAGPFPDRSRDPKDNYLLGYALAGQADYLVTGDQDLLALEQIDGVQIIQPGRFLLLLQQTATNP